MDPKMLKQFKGLSVNPDGGSPPTKKQTYQAQTTPRPLRSSMKEAVISHNSIRIKMNHFNVSCLSIKSINLINILRVSRLCSRRNFRKCCITTT
jgi:hypothetical protein